MNNDKAEEVDPHTDVGGRWSSMPARKRRGLLCIVSVATVVAFALGFVLNDLSQKLRPKTSGGSSEADSTQFTLCANYSQPDGSYFYEGVSCATCTPGLDSETLYLSECNHTCTAWTVQPSLAEIDPLLDYCEVPEDNYTGPDYAGLCPEGFYRTIKNKGCKVDTFFEVLLFKDECTYLGDNNVTKQKCIEACDTNPECAGYMISQYAENKCFALTNRVEYLCNNDDVESTYCKKIPSEFVCYDDVVPYSEALTACENVHGVLVDANDPIKRDRVSQYCTSASGCFVAYGGDDECFYVESSVEGVEVEFPCVTERGYCCELPTGAPTIAPTSSPTYTEYFVIPNQTTWEDAKKYCYDRGANLVSIHSDPEQDLVWEICDAKLIEYNNPCGCWTGFNRVGGPVKPIYTAADFFWSDGTTNNYNNFELFPEPQPDNKGYGERDNECVHMRPFQDGGWNDLPCGGYCDATDNQPFPLCRYFTDAPTQSPTLIPTSLPTKAPTSTPTVSPTTHPTHQPTESPTERPTEEPTSSPTMSPTYKPTEFPTYSPTDSPTTPAPSYSPTYSPSISPSNGPTQSPTDHPTEHPSHEPTTSPSRAPTESPTYGPSVSPTHEPTKSPETSSPTKSPSNVPTPTPTQSPSVSPSPYPTRSPTDSPSRNPTESPSLEPTGSPTESPTPYPTISPTYYPTKYPTPRPTYKPTKHPTPSPTKYPTKSPTGHPTKHPTPSPTKYPTQKPTKHPTPYPTTPYPTLYPTNSPTVKPSVHPQCYFKNGENLWTITNKLYSKILFNYVYNRSAYLNYVYDDSYYPHCSTACPVCFGNSFYVNAYQTGSFLAPADNVTYWHDGECDKRHHSRLLTGSGSDCGDNKCGDYDLDNCGGDAYKPQWKCKCLDMKYFSDNFDSYPPGIQYNDYDCWNKWERYSNAVLTVRNAHSFKYDNNQICSSAEGNCVDFSGVIRTKEYSFKFDDNDEKDLWVKPYEKHISRMCTASFKIGGSRRCGSKHYSSESQAKNAGCAAYYSGKDLKKSYSTGAKLVQNGATLAERTVSNVAWNQDYQLYGLNAATRRDKQEVFYLKFDGSDFDSYRGDYIGNFLDDVDVTCCCIERYDKYIYKYVAKNQGLTGKGKQVPVEKSNPNAIINKPPNYDYFNADYNDDVQHSTQVYSLGLGGSVIYRFDSGVYDGVYIFEETLVKCSYNYYTHKWEASFEDQSEDVSVEVSADGYNWITVAESLYGFGWSTVGDACSEISSRRLQAEEPPVSESEEDPIVVVNDGTDPNLDDNTEEYFTSNFQYETFTKTAALSSRTYSYNKYISRLRYVLVSLPNGACFKYVRVTDHSKFSCDADDGFDLHAIKAQKVCCNDADADDYYYVAPSGATTSGFEVVNDMKLKGGAFVMFILAAVGAVSLVALVSLQLRVRKSEKRFRKQSILDIETKEIDQILSDPKKRRRSGVDTPAVPVHPVVAEKQRRSLKSGKGRSDELTVDPADSAMSL